MKLILTITTYTEDYDLMNYISNDYVDQIAKILKYNIIKATCGKHVDASRTHYHNMVCYDISGAKVYKTLNEKINRLFTDLTYPTEDLGRIFQSTEKKISFIYEGEQKKFKKDIRLYDESAMCYPFKEYKENKEIPYDLQRGYQCEELKEMRKIANVSWCDVLRKRAKQQAMDIEKKEQENNMTEFLKSKMEHKEGDVNDLVKFVKHQIWKFKKEQYKKGAISSVRVGAIKDQAISFLVFEEYINIEETEDIV